MRHRAKGPSGTLAAGSLDRNKASGRAWARALIARSPRQAWELGDDLTLDTFDWSDWLDSKPPVGFMSGVCEALDAFERDA